MTSVMMGADGARRAEKVPGRVAVRRLKAPAEGVETSLRNCGNDADRRHSTYTQGEAVTLPHGNHNHCRLKCTFHRLFPLLALVAWRTRIKKKLSGRQIKKTLADIEEPSAEGIWC